MHTPGCACTPGSVGARGRAGLGGGGHGGSGGWNALLAPCSKPASEQALAGVQLSLVFVPFAVRWLGMLGTPGPQPGPAGERGTDSPLVTAASLGWGNGLWAPERERGRSHHCSGQSLCPHRSRRQHLLLSASYLSSVVPHHPPCLSPTPRAACPSSSSSLPACVGVLQAAPYFPSLCPPSPPFPAAVSPPVVCSSVLPSTVLEPPLCDMGSHLRDAEGHTDVLTGTGTHIFPPFPPGPVALPWHGCLCLEPRKTRARRSLMQKSGCVLCLADCYTL